MRAYWSRQPLERLQNKRAEICHQGDAWAGQLEPKNKNTAAFAGTRARRWRYIRFGSVRRRSARCLDFSRRLIPAHIFRKVNHSVLLQLRNNPVWLIIANYIQLCWNTVKKHSVTISNPATITQTGAALNSLLNFTSGFLPTASVASLDELSWHDMWERKDCWEPHTNIHW